MGEDVIADGHGSANRCRQSADIVVALLRLVQQFTTFDVVAGGREQQVFTLPAVLVGLA